jgi:SAM-dependent methyltransferase
METGYPPGLYEVLACPHCSQRLHFERGAATCVGCGERYPVSGAGRLDLRLRRRKRYPLEFELGSELPLGEHRFAPLRENPAPELDLSSVRVPHHLCRELISYFPRAKGPTSMALDLGCGAAIHREVCEQAGYQYVGLDYGAEQAPLLGDAHALPFRDDSFEFVLSIAVLEHLRYPFVALREVHRVLQPGKLFIGTVAFLEPFHDNSYYHHTHLGTLSALQHAGFRVEQVTPSATWPVLTAQASMGLFPKMPKPLARSVVLPVQALHRLWWGVAELLGKAEPATRVCRMTGAFYFIARKEAAGHTAQPLQEPPQERAAGAA